MLRFGNIVKIQCKEIQILALIQQGYWENLYCTFFAIMFCLYWISFTYIEMKKMVVNDQQCFALTPCLQGFPNEAKSQRFKCWQLLAGSWQESFIIFSIPRIEFNHNKDFYYRGWVKKKYTDFFKSGGNILAQSASRRKNKLFIIKFPLKSENLIINNLF